MNRKPWTRDEALIAFNIYCRLPFGRLHSRNPEIQRVASLLDRSPSSLAMKCCNLASLDPAQQERGISGLQKVAQVDRMIWDEFESDPENVSFESEIALAKLEGRAVDTPARPDVSRVVQPISTDRPSWEDVAGLDKEAVVRVRVNQRFFRTMILATYDAQCAVCNLPIPILLIASHIIPWSIDPSQRMNPRNGICLCALHDRAFDAGVVEIDNTYTVRLPRLDQLARSAPSVAQTLVAYEGRSIRLPERWQPDARLLERRTAMAQSAGTIQEPT